MGGQHHGGVPLATLLQDELLHQAHVPAVDVGGGLVEEIHIRFHDKGPRQGHPLSLASGQLVGAAIEEMLQ